MPPSLNFPLVAEPGLLCGINVILGRVLNNPDRINPHGSYGMRYNTLPACVFLKSAPYFCPHSVRKCERDSKLTADKKNLGNEQALGTHQSAVDNTAQLHWQAPDQIKSNKKSFILVNEDINSHSGV